MASRKMLVHLDMDENSFIKAGFEQLSSNPATELFKGRQVWNTTTDKPMVYNGTIWVDLSASLTVSANGSTPSLTVDNSTAGLAVLAIANANGTDAGLMSTTDFDLVATATSLATNDALVLRDAVGSIAVTSVTGLSAPTNPGDAVNKTYVDNLIATGMSVEGNIDCSANPNYPVATVGDAYYVSVAGKIGGALGEVVAVGDLTLCTTTSAAGDEAAVGTNWMVLERNLDNATDTVAGYVRLATSAEVTTGTATDAVTTVANVTSMVNAASTATYIVKLALGSATFAVNHALNGDVITQVLNKTTGDVVEVDISRTDANNIVVSTNIALTVDHIAMCTYIGVEPA